MDYEQFKKFEQNLQIFGGYITQPDVRYFENGKCKCNFAIPLKINKDDDPIWLNCECWGKNAEKAGELKKGDEVLVLGYFKTEEYQDKNKVTKTKITFVVKGIL